MDGSFLNGMHGNVICGPVTIQLVGLQDAAPNYAVIRHTVESRVRGCRLSHVTLLINDHDAPTSVIENSEIVDSHVALGASVQRSTLVRCIVAAGAVVSDSTCSGLDVREMHARLAAVRGGSHAAPAPALHRDDATFGCGVRISIGNSTGGRFVRLCDVTSFAQYVQVVSQPALTSPTHIQAHHEAVAARCAALRDAVTVAYPVCDIGAGSIVHGCRDVVRIRTRGVVTLLDTHALSDCSVYGSAAAPTLLRSGCSMSRSVVHPGCLVDSSAHVDSSVLCALSGARRGATVSESVLASGSVVSSGEVSHSLVGPLVAIHHTSLLIAALWPSGKGNVAYGANVGSNHTGKLPDQEIQPGEGVFFGLGVCVKFPADFTLAPYSLVAAGVTTLPQRVELPFSLIATGAGSLPAPSSVTPAINELMPGWMLSDNAYALHRNEMKYSARAAAIARGTGAACVTGTHPADAAYDGSDAWRGVGVVHGILQRRDMVAHMARGRELLASAKRPRITLKGAAVAKDAAAAVPGDAVYTEVEVRGLGKNYMTEAARARGVAAFTRYIQAAAVAGVASAVLGETDACSRWQVQLACSEGILRAESVPVTTASEDSIAGAALVSVFGRDAIVAVLQRYAKQEEEEAAAAASSKRRDTERGKRISADYEASHADESVDAVIAHLRKRARETRTRVDAWLASGKS